MDARRDEIRGFLFSNSLMKTKKGSKQLRFEPFLMSFFCKLDV